MGSEVWTALAGSIGAIAFFGGIALVMWIDQKGKAREKELAHIERMKALELGLPLPDADIARANAEATRARAAGLTAILVPLGMAGAAVGATPLVFHSTTANVHLPLLCVIWGVCGLVGLVGVSVAFETPRKREKSASKQTPHTPATPEKQSTVDAIRAADVPVQIG
jgi:hypothetical protein